MNRSFITCFAVAVGSAVSPVLGVFSQESGSEYVGPQACRSCHVEIYDSYQKVGMARSFDRIDRVSHLEDWTGKNRFYHKASKQYFVVTRRDGKFFQRRYQLDSRGQEINSLEREIHFVLGSGNKERDYFHLSETGELTQLPVVWYSEEQSWGIAPGYDRPVHPGFSRRIDYRCIFCHNAYPPLPDGWARYEAQQSRFPRKLPSGIDCERCHGPGRLHTEKASTPAPNGQIRQSIVNPARLSRKLQLDVCMQCHLETSSALLPDMVVKMGREIFSYRPGEPLEDYASYFDFPAGSGHDDDFNIVHQAYRLRKSLCFRASSMTCTTCHDPHRVPANKREFYNEKCATCHVPDDCTLDRKARAASGDNCVACHMPQRRTQDVIHVVMTDHYIQRRPRKNLLAPLAERDGREYRGDLTLYLSEAQQDLYLGLALARGADTARGVALLERVIQRNGLRAVEPYYYLGFGYDALGKPERAIESYGRALEIDPRYAEARYNLGIALMKKGEIQKAREAFEEVIRQQPTLTDAHIALSTAILRANEGILRPVMKLELLAVLDAARKHNLDVLQLDPISTVALNNLGLIEIQLEHWDQAEVYFRQVLRVQPDNATARANLERIQGRKPTAKVPIERLP